MTPRSVATFWAAYSVALAGIMALAFVLMASRRAAIVALLAMASFLACVGLAHAEPPPCPGVEIAGQASGVPIGEGCPAPVAGWLYSASAWQAMRVERDAAAAALDASAIQLRALEVEIADIEEPPSRLAWFGLGVVAAAAVLGTTAVIGR